MFFPSLKGFWLILILVTALRVGWSQDTSSPQIAHWREGLRLVDSNSLADIVAAESILKSAIQKSRPPAGADGALAIVELRQSRPESAIEILSDLPKRFEAHELTQMRLLNLRISLYAALELENAVQATAAFKDLVRSVVAESSDLVDLRHSAITLGVVIAMLEVDLAKSLISKHDLAIGQTCMLTSKVSGIASAYSAAHAQAGERSAELIRQFESIKQQGLAAVEAKHAERLKELNKLVSELEDQKELASEIYRNSKEQTGQNTRDQRKLHTQISAFQAQLRQPTAGHPGPQRTPPIPPNRNRIVVNEFETITDYEDRYQNGERYRVAVNRIVRRDQSDIDRERDRLYRQMMSEFQFVRDEYDRYATNYQRALSSWTEADRTRRNKLSEQIAEAEAKRKELLNDTERIKAEQKITAKGVVATRTVKQQEEFELQLQAIAIASTKAGSESSAFRPRNFPVLSWTQERFLIDGYFK